MDLSNEADIKGSPDGTKSNEDSGVEVKIVNKNHGLRTPNEGINQRYLKNWADVADKICFGRT